jgi:predicted membrane channel-forming protein YqfA (hemolysin III family)
VRSGYRWHASPRAALACAVCCFNNETFNVVSHGLSLLWLAYYVASGRAAAAWPGGAGWRLALHLTPIALCLAASALYHALLADAARYHLYLALDVAGVFLLAAAGGAGLATRGLPCAPQSYRAAATAAVATLAVLALRRASLARTPAARALPLAALLGGRLALLAWRAAAGTAPPAAVRRYLAAELLSAAGAAVNAARLPEAWWARRRRAGTPLLTDLIGNSHNIFHAAVLAALAAYHGAASADERAAVAARAVCFD